LYKNTYETVFDIVKEVASATAYEVACGHIHTFADIGVAFEKTKETITETMIPIVYEVIAVIGCKAIPAETYKPHIKEAMDIIRVAASFALTDVNSSTTMNAVLQASIDICHASL
jgi:Ni,Fe-hydrogenase I small subunit